MFGTLRKGIAPATSNTGRVGRFRGSGRIARELGVIHAHASAAVGNFSTDRRRDRSRPCRRFSGDRPDGWSVVPTYKITKEVAPPGLDR